MTKNPTLRRFMWGVSFFVAVFVNFPIIVLNLPRLSKPMVQLDIVLQVVISFMYALIFIQWVYRAIKRSYSLKKQWSGAMLMLIAYSALLTLANTFIIGLPLKTASTVITRGGLMAMIGYAFIRFMTETEKKNEVLIENEQLKHENLLVQLTSLKNQLNPHFLFNSLNTLSWLINEDKAKSQRYLQKLSQVLRYSLSMQEQSLVSLKEELALVESYVFLLRMRFGENLHVSINADNTEHCQIPPLSLQLLIENAIKHNIISSSEPLKVMIRQGLSDKTIWVINSLRPKPDSTGTGIGLANLNQRFKLLTNREIEIKRDDASFSVVLPLVA
ncbi:sensor histidine kinase [Runella slithyformis]|nr:histidine kinase [Runella slithyformis]